MAKESDKLDTIDLRLLSALQGNARLSQQELSEQVNLSPSPVARRIRQLEQKQVIRGYTTVIDETKLGFELSVFVSVKLDQQIDDRLVSFEQAIADYPEVVDCWLMTGARDYLLRIAVEDLQEFERFLTGRLTKVPGVASIESSIPIRRVKHQQARIY